MKNATAELPSIMEDVKKTTSHTPAIAENVKDITQDGKVIAQNVKEITGSVQKASPQIPDFLTTTQETVEDADKLIQGSAESLAAAGFHAPDERRNAPSDQPAREPL